MTSLNEIVHSFLLNRYSLHWYLESLSYAVECLRELQYDVLGTSKSKKIEISSYNTIAFPCDYMDMVRIGVASGDRIIRSSSIQTSTRLVNVDENGNKVPYGSSSNWSYGDRYGAWIYPGSYASTPTHNSFTVIKERQEIELKGFCGDFVILDYITDGSEIDNASMVHPYAVTTIKQYIEWQMKKRKRGANGGECEYEKQQYETLARRLRGRLNPMTPADVIASWDRSYGKQK